jgi:hypothetical protein
MTDDLEAGAAEEMRDVLPRACEEIVETDDLMPVCQEPLAQMGADETGPAGNEDAPGACVGVIGVHAIRLCLSDGECQSGFTLPGGAKSI